MYFSSEYVDMILTFARCGNNAREAVRLYREQFPQRQIRRSWGYSKKCKDCRTRGVLNVFEEDGTRSIRTVSREMGLSKSS
ncbi:unnamed protein product, partial [Tenebrio molitor]